MEIPNTGFQWGLSRFLSGTKAMMMPRSGNRRAQMYPATTQPVGFPVPSGAADLGRDSVHFAPSQYQSFEGSSGSRYQPGCAWRPISTFSSDIAHAVSRGEGA